jgi:hypothetical protein
MSELSIIIPTIGRNSILDTLESVRNFGIYEYIIVDDSETGLSSQLKSRIKALVPGVTFLCTDGTQGPGVAKSLGVSRVCTKYFLILDDDDKLRIHGIDLILSILKDLSPDWLSFHWGSDDPNWKDLKFRYVPVNGLYDRLFDFSVYDPKGNFDVIYPGSSIVFNTKKFRNQGILMKHRYADDALASSVFMYRHPGIDILMNLGIVGHTTDSVSRGLPNESDVRESLLEIKDFKNLTRSSDERKFLNKVIDNIFKRLNHIGFNKLNRDEFTL